MTRLAWGRRILSSVAPVALAVPLASIPLRQDAQGILQLWADGNIGAARATAVRMSVRIGR
jgi:hypothetical protein